jgi:hypothetical protein
MAVLRKAVATNGNASHPSRMKRIAVGAAVVGAFVAGAVAGVRKDKIKAFAKKAQRNVKSKVRQARTAAANKVRSVRIAAADKVADVRERVMG